jgi:hypothetical protein
MPSYEKKYYQNKQKELENKIKYLYSMQIREENRKLSYKEIEKKLDEEIFMKKQKDEKCTLTGAGVSAL